MMVPAAYCLPSTTMGPCPYSKVKVPVAIDLGSPGVLGGGGLIIGGLVIPNLGTGTFGCGFMGVGGRATPCVWSTPFTGGNSWARSVLLEDSEPWDDPTAMGGRTWVFGTSDSFGILGMAGTIVL